MERKLDKLLLSTCKLMFITPITSHYCNCNILRMIKYDMIQYVGSSFVTPIIYSYTAIFAAGMSDRTMVTISTWPI